MPADDYTPSADDMKRAWAYYLDGRYEGRRAERDAEFDRFIAQVRAEAREEAEGALDGVRAHLIQVVQAIPERRAHVDTITQEDTP